MSLFGKLFKKEMGSKNIDLAKESILAELSGGWYGIPSDEIADSQTSYFANGYYKNPWLYSVVHGIAQLAATTPYYFAKDVDGEESRLEGRELSAVTELKRLLERPNMNQTGSEFFEMLYVHVMISPVTYIYKRKDEAGRIEDLWILPDDVVTTNWLNEQLKIPKSYSVSVPGLVKGNTADVADMVVIRNLDMTYTAQVEGASPLRPARVVLEKSNTAIASGKTMTANMGAVGLAALTDPDAGPDDAQKVEKKYQAKFTGKDKIGRIVFTNADMKYFPIGHPVKDMMFSESDIQAIRAFCAIYNAPSQLFGDVAGSTYSNYKEARRALYTNAVLPLFKRVHEILAWRLYPDFRGLQDIWTAPDINRIPEMQIDLKEQAGAITSLISHAVMTPNEARAELNREPLDNVFADDLYQQNLSPLNGFTDEADTAG